MNNNFIPEIFKDKLANIINWFKGSLFFLLSITIFLSVFTFNINDDSFLTESSGATSNVIGTVGSYSASFLVYSFGFFQMSSSFSTIHLSAKNGERCTRALKQKVRPAWHFTLFSY